MGPTEGASKARPTASRSERCAGCHFQAGPRRGQRGRPPGSGHSAGPTGRALLLRDGEIALRLEPRASLRGDRRGIRVGIRWLLET